MDYADMIAFHRRCKADLTIAMQRVPWEETSRFGVAETDASGRIIRFQEKPKSNPVSNLASLGIYVFDTEVLLRRLAEDAEKEDSKHDFGMNVIPGMLECDRVYAYEFSGYWRDVGTIQSYWDANMESLDPSSGLDLIGWQLRTNYYEPRPANEVTARIGRSASVRNSYIARGCVVEGLVEHSILFPGVHVEQNSVVRDSIVMNNTWIGPNCHVERAILDKNVRLEAHCKVGLGDASIANEKFPHLLSTGIVVVGKNADLPRGLSVGQNVLIYPDAAPSDFPASGLKDGATVISQRKTSGVFAL